MTDLELGRCPLCLGHLSAATYEQGRREEGSGQLKPASVTFEPCGHRVEGDAAWQWRNGMHPR